MLLCEGVQRETFQVAEIRYKFYNGVAQTTQNDLSAVLENEMLFRKLPEAKLVQVEIFLENGQRENTRTLVLENNRNRSTYPS